MKKQRDKKKKKVSDILSRIAIALMLLVGIALVLYPTVADMINDSLNNQAIDAYKGQLLTLDDSKYKTMLKAAQDYNDRLFRSDPYIGALTVEERKEYESLLNLDSSGMMGYIEVPKSDIYLAVYHGTDEAVLQIGSGHLDSSSLPVPGTSVHTVLSGHSGLPSARLFTDLDQLKIGDTFKLHILSETLIYEVESIQRVEPGELKDLRIEQGKELCTLMTCTPYGINTDRLLVTGHRIETPQAAPSQDSTLAAAIVTSKWNWWFAFLPAILFAGIVITVILIHRRKKMKKQPDPESREEEIQS